MTVSALRADILDYVVDISSAFVRGIKNITKFFKFCQNNLEHKKLKSLPIFLVFTQYITFKT